MQKKKEYYRQYARYYLHPNEKVDLLPKIIEEMEAAYKQREAHIQKLYKEVKQIKKLKI